MSFEATLHDLSDNASSIKLGQQAALHKRLADLLRIGGTLPVSPLIIQKLMSLQASERVTIDAVAHIIGQDPVFSLRLIALCNNSYYSRGNTISTVEGAINHLGLMRIAEVGRDLSDVKQYSTCFHGRAVAACTYQQMVLAGIIGERFYSVFSADNSKKTNANLMSSMSKIWCVLLAYLRPNIYAGLALDTLVDRKASLEKMVRKVTGKALADLGVEVMAEIGLPKDFSQLFSMLGVPPWIRRSWKVERTDHIQAVIAVAYLANRVADEICSFRGYQPLSSLIRELASKSKVSRDLLKVELSGCLEQFCASINLMGMTPFRLPEYLLEFDEAVVERDGKLSESTINWPPISDRVKPFLYELKACFKTTPNSNEFNRSAQVIYATLLALIRGLNFDRAIFFRYEEIEKVLHPAFLMGREIDAVESHARYVSEAAQKFMPDVQAFFEQRPIFHGDPIFGDDWPFAAFPVIWDGKVLGVFYADKKARADADSLGVDEQVAIIALAEEWHDVSYGFY
ncbi:HDOD domain-containing protein [Oligoflexia bacterium]|nr:HDOD domain-containing protein [Oligoflexia bacterium]